MNKISASISKFVLFNYIGIYFTVFSLNVNIIAQTSFSFEKISTPSGKNISSTWGFFFDHENILYAVTTNKINLERELYSSKNSGDTWSKVYNLSEFGSWTSYPFLQGNEIAMNSTSGGINKYNKENIIISSNGGQNWKFQLALPEGFDECVYIDNTTIECKKSSNKSLVTFFNYENGTWKTGETVTSYGNLEYVSIGLNEKILINENSVFNPNSYSIPYLGLTNYYSLKFGSPVYAHGRIDRRLYITYDYNQWYESLLPDNGKIDLIYPICNDNLVFVLIGKGIIYTTDKGVSWNYLNVPDENSRQLIYSPEGRLFLYGGNGEYLYRSNETFDCQCYKKEPKKNLDAPCNSYSNFGSNLSKGYIDASNKILNAPSNTDILNENITCAYTNLYLSNPKKFKWAGLAALVSGEIGIQEKENRWKLDIIGLMNSLMEGNKAVFKDLYWQHLAFSEKGISEMEKLYCENSISEDEYMAWKKISTDNVWGGNLELLLHEQKDILQPILYESHPEWWYLTDSWAGIVVNFGNVLKSPVPNDDEVFTSGINQNIANFNQRWEWIESHIIPQWRKFEESSESKTILIEEFKKICPSCCE